MQSAVMYDDGSSVLLSPGRHAAWGAVGSNERVIERTGVDLRYERAGGRYERGL